MLGGGGGGGGGGGARIFAYHHDVGVCAVSKITRDGGLGQHQQFVAVGELRQHVLSEAGNAKPARHVDRRASVADRTTLISEQHEMPVCQPTQKCRNVFVVPSRESAVGGGVELVRKSAHRRHHRTGVQCHLPGIGQDTRQLLG